MANDLASWLRESQVVSMCLKLAIPRTRGGLSKKTHYTLKSQEDEEKELARNAANF